MMHFGDISNSDDAPGCGWFIAICLVFALCCWALGGCGSTRYALWKKKHGRAPRGASTQGCNHTQYSSTDIPYPYWEPTEVTTRRSKR